MEEAQSGEAGRRLRPSLNVRVGACVLWHPALDQPDDPADAAGKEPGGIVCAGGSFRYFGERWVRQNHAGNYGQRKVFGNGETPQADQFAGVEPDDGRAKYFTAPPDDKLDGAFGTQFPGRDHSPRMAVLQFRLCRTSHVLRFR